jgi:hypothetical protein
MKVNSLLSLRDLKLRIKRLKCKRLKKRTLKHNNSFRFTKWYPGLNYKQIKPAKRVFENVKQIQDAFNNKQLTCNHLSQYCHKDKEIGRDDRSEPRYAAVFTLKNGGFIQPQQKHYRQCYQNSNRKDREKAYTLLEDSTPYWCCVYADRLKSERMSKKKYTQSRKNKKAFL